MAHIFTVSELSQAVGGVLEGEFPFIWVRGQVSNLHTSVAGHQYFTLKDSESILSVAWFKGNQWTAGQGAVNPLTGEVNDEPPLVLANDLEVLCAGKIKVYGPRGTYQLIAELVQEQGVGNLAQEFERLKRELSEAGYFDAERKQPLPVRPKRIALVTSPRGAAIRDFLRIASNRGSGAEIRVHPVLVQGDAAPAQIADAVRLANTEGWADTIVLIRGGGSLEDLWAFNTRPVARAIFESSIPVLSGVGHEIDTTIADFCADKRAATPSHAAQLLWPERRELVQLIDDLEATLGYAFSEQMSQKLHALAQVERALSWQTPGERLERMKRECDNLRQRLDSTWEKVEETCWRNITQCCDKMTRAFGPQSFVSPLDHVENLDSRLSGAMSRFMEKKAGELEKTGLALTGADPERPLQKGYSLVRLKSTGGLVQSASDATPGDELDITLKEGRIAAEVTATLKD